MRLLQRILSSRQGRISLVLLAPALIEIGILLGGPAPWVSAREAAALAAAGKDLPWALDTDLGISLAACVNLGLLLALVASTGWWSRPFRSIALPAAHSAIRAPRWFWPLVLAAIALCLMLRLPLASKSLWWDECWVIRQCSHGSWRPDKDRPGELKFSPTNWKRCAFYYQKPTNHVPMSLAQKAGLTLWRALTGAPRHAFSDLAARVPSLLASAAAILLIACLLRRWNRPGVGVVAALLLAIHPWHIRYGVDARGYALVVPLCISALLAATCILDSRGRFIRHWVWLGLNQFLWLWSYPNAVIDVAIFTIVLGILLWRQELNPPDRWTVLTRLGLTHVFAAMLLLQVFLPNVMQARHWAGQEADAHTIDRSVLLDTISQVAFGTPWQDAGPPGFAGAPEAAAAASVLSGDAIARMLLVPFVLLVLFGFWSLRFDAGSRRWLVWSIIASSLTFMGTTWLAGSYFYPRFAIALLPVTVIGLAWNCRDIQRWPSVFVRIITIVPILGAFGIATLPARNVLAAVPYSPLRNIAEFVAAESPRQKTEPLVLCYGLGREALPIYYPQSVGVTTPAEIESNLRKARAEQRPLYLVQGYDAFNRSVLPDGFRLIDDEALFQTVAEFPGIEPDFHFRVLKARR